MCVCVCVYASVCGMLCCVNCSAVGRISLSDAAEFFCNCKIKAHLLVANRKKGTKNSLGGQTKLECIRIDLFFF